MKKFILFFIVIVFAVFAGGVFGKTLQKEDTKIGKTAEKAVAVVIPDTPTPTSIPLGKPAELSIPKLNIHTPIEYVANDKDGNMDTPKNDMHVAWYEPGFLPGQTGNAVIAGHFDRKDGGPAIFYNLNKLEKGDEIVVADEHTKLLTFIVTGKNTYPVKSFPVSTVFGSSDKKYLNLITCGGVWDPVQKIYADRWVVTAALKE